MSYPPSALPDLRNRLFESLVKGTLNLPRRGALNFVVGVNGSGKSSILRTLYRIFVALSRRERPALPVTLAWDRQVGQGTRTAVLHTTTHRDRRSFFATLAQVPADTNGAGWETLTRALGDAKPHPLAEDLDIEHGEASVQLPVSAGLLPKRLIAYSSGAEDAWIELDRPELHPAGDDTEPPPAEAERPPGWTMEQEMEDALRRTGKVPDEVRARLATNRMLDSQAPDDAHLRIRTPDLRLAGIVLALLQAAKELKDTAGDRALEALRRRFLQDRAERRRPEDGRRVLNEIDWFRPTHLSLVYRDTDDRTDTRQREELFCLLALADTVVAQPGGRMRAVVPLGASEGIGLSERLRDSFPLGLPGRGVERIIGRIDGAASGAEAVLSIFSADEWIDSTPLDVLARLRDWQRTGLLDEMTLTIQRLHRSGPDGRAEREADDQAPNQADAEHAGDDVLVTYDQLSDGEQMLLGRMGMISLLRGQDGSLLLLDEPETHFNDVWKRELVEMLDMGLLEDTQANVIVATHTSIALTDAFAAEVTVLDKTDRQISARGVRGGLFGTDPGEVNMNLFRADSSTGRRSEQILNRLLTENWAGKGQVLEQILTILGSSLHRAELRAILKNLQTDDDGPASA